MPMTPHMSGLDGPVGLDDGLIDDHDRDVVLDGVDAVAGDALQALFVGRELDVGLAQGAGQDGQERGADRHIFLRLQNSGPAAWRQAPQAAPYFGFISQCQVSISPALLRISPLASPRPGNLRKRFPPPAAGPPSLTGASWRHPSPPRDGYPGNRRRTISFIR